MTPLFTPKPADVRGLAEDFTSLGFQGAADVSPEPRGWATWPRELLRNRMLPPVPAIASGSVWARRDLARFERQRPAAGALFRLLTLGEDMDAAAARAIPADLLQRFESAGLIERRDGRFQAVVRVVPLHGLFLLADFPSRRGGQGAAHVQLGLDSAQLATMIAAEAGPGGRALDLCAGGGIQALMLARQGWRAEGTDVSPRAVAFAQANAALNGLEDRASFRHADLFDGCDGQYDLVVSNPPFMFLPPEEARVNLTGDGGALGIQITMRILEGLQSRLAEGGRAFVYTQAPRIDGRCALADAAGELVKRAPLTIDLEEIHRGYWSLFREFYLQMRVEWLSCYRIRVNRAGSGSIRTRPTRGWRDAVLRATVAAERRGA